MEAEPIGEGVIGLVLGVVGVVGGDHYWCVRGFGYELYLVGVFECYVLLYGFVDVGIYCE